MHMNPLLLIIISIIVVMAILALINEGEGLAWLNIFWSQ